MFSNNNRDLSNHFHRDAEDENLYFINDISFKSTIEKCETLSETRVASYLECPLRIKYRECVILRYYVIYDDKMITKRMMHNILVGIGTRFFHFVPTGILYTDRLVIVC